MTNAPPDESLNEVTPEPINEEEIEEAAKKVPIVHKHAFPKFFGFLRELQRYSSYSFLGFLTIHAASVVIAPAVSPNIGDSSIQLTREIYQTPLVEPWLVYASVLTHVSCGIVLGVRRIYYNLKNYGRLPKIQPVRASGYMLIPFLFIHTSVVRELPYNILGDSSLISLNFVAHGFHRYPVLSWLGYTGLVFFAVNHTIWGLKRWFNLYSERSSFISDLVRWASILLGVISLYRISKLAPMTGWVGKRYQEVYSALMSGRFM